MTTKHLTNALAAAWRRGGRLSFYWVWKLQELVNELEYRKDDPPPDWFIVAVRSKCEAAWQQLVLAALGVLRLKRPWCVGCGNQCTVGSVQYDWALDQVCGYCSTCKSAAGTISALLVEDLLVLEPLGMALVEAESPAPERVARETVRKVGALNLDRFSNLEDEAEKKGSSNG